MLAVEGLTLEFPLRMQEIKQLVPHRYPFLLIDKVTEFVDGEYIVGEKCVSVNEPYFAGHFPEQPIMPGVLILEALAQLGVVYAKLASGGAKEGQLIVFSAADAVRFRRPVFPGDVLRLEMQHIARRQRYWKMQGIASVDGQRVAEAQVMATVT